MVSHIILEFIVKSSSQKLNVVQQVIAQGQVAQTGLKQVAIRIYQDSQRTSDAGLKDLLAREQITYKPTAGTGSETPATPTK